MITYANELKQLYNIKQVKSFNNIILTPVITFQITEDCNLKCKYCYQTNKTYSVMSLETAKKFIDLLIANDDNTKQYIDTQQCIGVVLDFIGGEPLLQPKLIDEIVDYFRTQTIIHNHPWQYNWRISICSNGTLYFNPEVQELIKKYQKHLSLSITVDGNKEIHDACRIFPNGEGSYDKAIAAVRHYKKYWHGFMGSKVTFSPDNIIYAGDAIINLINEDYTDIHANCVFEKGWENKHATIFYNEMKKMADYILDNDLEYQINLSLFVENFFQPLPIDDTQNWCGGNARMLALGPDGNIYPCIRYMPSSLGNIRPITIGNVDDGIMTTQEQRDEINELKAVNRINQSSEECINCSIAKGCSYCFPAGTKIRVPSGYNNIENLQIGNKIIDKDGNIQIIENIITHKVNKDELIYINAAGVLPLLTTKNHPFLALPVVKRYNNRPIYSTEPQWIKAGDLRVTDRIGLYVPKCGDKDIDKTIAYLIGRYLGDGYKTESKRKKHPFLYYIVCGKHEKEQLLNKFKLLPDIKFTEVEQRTIYSFKIPLTNNEFMYNILEQCGRNALTKKVPKDIYSWNIESIKALLNGYFDADGDNNGKIQRYTTISPDLAYGIAELVRMVFHKNVSITYMTPPKKTMIEGRVVNQHPYYQCRYHIEEEKRHFYYFDEKYNIMWVNVSSCKKELPSELLVYNLTVSNSNTYIANDVLVHNCQAFNYQDSGDFHHRATYICCMHKARALANVYYWNRFYIKNLSGGRFKNYLPDEEALKIIDEKELQMLKDLENTPIEKVE